MEVDIKFNRQKEMLDEVWALLADVDGAAIEINGDDIKIDADLTEDN